MIAQAILSYYQPGIGQLEPGVASCFLSGIMPTERAPPFGPFINADQT